MPLAVSTTTPIGRIASTSTNPSTWSTYAGRRSRCSTVPRLAPGSMPASTSERISRRPVSSPTGRAPGWQNFKPLYCFGLWLAVIMIPGRSSAPLAK